MKNIFCLFLFFWFQHQCVFGAVPSAPVVAGDSIYMSREEWKAIKEGHNYDESFEREQRNQSHAPVSSGGGGANLSGFRYIIYAAVLVLIIYLAVRLINSFNDNPKTEQTKVTVENIEDVEENIHEVDLEALCQEALKSGNFRLALRLNFLIIIKLLSQGGHIQWSRDKTNWEYYRELQDRMIADTFKMVINDFESSWYGEHLVTEFHFHQSEPMYRELQRKLKT